MGVRLIPLAFLTLNMNEKKTRGLTSSTSASLRGCFFTWTQHPHYSCRLFSSFFANDMFCCAPLVEGHYEWPHCYPKGLRITNLTVWKGIQLTIKPRVIMFQGWNVWVIIKILVLPPSWKYMYVKGKQVAAEWVKWFKIDHISLYFVNMKWKKIANFESLYYYMSEQQVIKIRFCYL